MVVKILEILKLISYNVITTKKTLSDNMSGRVFLLRLKKRLNYQFGELIIVNLYVVLNVF